MALNRLTNGESVLLVPRCSVMDTTSLETDEAQVAMTIIIYNAIKSRVITFQNQHHTSKNGESNKRNSPGPSALRLPC
jgi:hypothetical protein